MFMSALNRGCEHKYKFSRLTTHCCQLIVCRLLVWGRHVCPDCTALCTAQPVCGQAWLLFTDTTGFPPSLAAIHIKHGIVPCCVVGHATCHVVLLAVLHVKQSHNVHKNLWCTGSFDWMCVLRVRFSGLFQENNKANWAVKSETGTSGRQMSMFFSFVHSNDSCLSQSRKMFHIKFALVKQLGICTFTFSPPSQFRETQHYHMKWLQTQISALGAELLSEGAFLTAVATIPRTQFPKEVRPCFFLFIFLFLSFFCASPPTVDNVPYFFRCSKIFSQPANYWLQGIRFETIVLFLGTVGVG